MVPQAFLDAVTCRFSNLYRAVEREELPPLAVYKIAAKIQTDFLEAMAIYCALYAE